MGFYETLTMVLMFAVRIGIPVLITLGISYLYDRLAERWDEAPEQTAQEVGSGASAMLQLSRLGPLNEVCPLCERATAACTRWSNVPCWLALQLVEGQIPDECLGCVRFTDGDLQTHQLAGA
jgi:hypothetical protein